ncbi:thiamine-phosphate kinase [Pseudoalteromonas sp. McH1-7]|uniref:Thiamine-monophosphate kinase n=1 Tax=Pseudoalteromonas peptidolytica F12-50-A1 TaxID=1315280 RepID=A0A8I0T4T2_9GAMM|nr:MULTISPECIES: thiamine-phosphate kinase [Pseudoalteromonas]MBE0345499.1 thiamine-monophosphate kinase [Pseudoalteromonas peptidolytica F12-50-A1]MDW7547602.1 thiamine-phosphate kinase [Pseudoalteromonas peptidolytica]NLR13444.1 thiamine-phosphate kinase [Pseudoalteromonas peptidolytica]NUZ09716.1 thiamine-phosphate kinase [Pseudoalteromonas sp. McH1-7]RXE95162.1 thiamine-phosphate kinase [Pseudoalteromonas sp. PS5]
MKEFELINRYFKGRGIIRRDVELGIGDDCALVSVPTGHQLAVTTDTLVSGVHFFEDIPPRALGHRVIAVNLSDLAAMGAEPTWISLGLTLPTADMEWLEAFTEGMHEIAEYYNVQVIGGDTTQGPLTITVCAKGIVPNGKALKRSSARVGDWIYVTGSLGDAGLAIEARKQELMLDPLHYKAALDKFHYPAPRVAAGQVLRGLATSAIDISDGLLADLQHILKASLVGAKIHVDKVPMSNALRASLDEAARLRLALSFGDDYELLFTVNDNNKNAVETRLKQYGVEPVCIGQITAHNGEVQLVNKGQPYQLSGQGFEHFS